MVADLSDDISLFENGFQTVQRLINLYHGRFDHKGDYEIMEAVQIYNQLYEEALVEEVQNLGESFTEMESTLAVPTVALVVDGLWDVAKA